MRIEIIAIGEDKIYSVGAISVSKKGDVYIIHKTAGTDFHTSRHADGKTHWKSKQQNFFQKLREGVPIKDFRGIEFLGTHSFGLDSLPQIFKEYKMKKNNGVFAIDMREYKQAAFNMTIAILTEEGLSSLYNNWKNLKKRQIYIFTDCHPMIAITIADVKIPSESS